MNATQKASLLVLAVILVIVVSHLLVFRPRAAAFSQLEELNRDLTQQVAEARDRRAALPRVREEIAEARERLERTEERYPDSIEPFYRFLSEAEPLTGKKIISTREERGPGVETEGVEERLIHLEGRGLFREVGEFLEKLKNLPIGVSVTRLQIQGDEMWLPEVNVEMTLSVFIRRNN